MTGMLQSTFCSSCESEWHKGANHSKHFFCQQDIDFASVWVRPQNFKYLAPRYNNFLLLSSREVAMYRMRNPSGSLQR